MTHDIFATMKTDFRKHILSGILSPVVAGVLFIAGLTSASAQSGPDATLAAAARETDAKVTASGLVIRTIKAGTGTQPTPSSTVRVHYKGTFPDGREFDSSYKRGEPAEFPLSGVIKCWTEGVQLIKVGGKKQPSLGRLRSGWKIEPPSWPSSRPRSSRQT